MRLHQINQANYSAAGERDILLSMQTGDAILLLEAATLKLLNDQDTLVIAAKQNAIPIYVLTDELECYGIKQAPNVEQGVDAVQRIDALQWVELTTQFETIISW